MGKPGHETLPLPAVVHRERLLRRLRQVLSPGIVVLSAQAAQGKSTLIADYLASRQAESCWVRLRPDDGDPSAFLDHLLEASRPHRLPKSRPALHRPEAGLGWDAIPGKISRLRRHLPVGLHLVIEGCHHLGPFTMDSPFIDALLSARPHRGFLYLISRESVAIHLQRNRMQRQALLLTGDELAFTEREIEDFFDIVAGVTVTAEHARRLHALTDGWVGGLVLTMEALHRYPGDPEAVLGGAALVERVVAEAEGFFREAVYDRQPSRMQRFLAAAALLDTVPSDLMRGHMGAAEADRLYAEAVRQNLFIHGLSAGTNHWHFRFNPLFRAFLRSAGPSVLSPQTIEAFRQTAARHYAAAGDGAAAVRHYLAAGDTTEAAIGITKMGFQLARDGRFSEIDRWTAMLPPKMLEDDPWLALLKAFTFRIKGGQRTIRELEAVKKAFDLRKRPREKMFALAYLIETAVFIGYDPAARARWIAEGEALLKEASSMPRYTYAKALLWQQIGLGLIAGTSTHLQKGLSACRNAVILGKRIGARHLVAIARTIAAHAHVQAGELDQARENLRAAENPESRGPFPEYDAFRDLTGIQLELIGGHLSLAGDLLKRVASDIDTFGLIILYPTYLEACGLLQVYRQEYAELEKTRRHLRDVGVLLNNPVYSARASWLAGLGSYHRGRHQRALDILRSITPTPHLPKLHQAFNRELMGFIELNTDAYGKAATHLRKALASFDNAGMALAACETRLGLALVHDARRDREAARACLDAAFQAIAAYGYRHFPVLRTADLSRACELGLALGVPAAAERARQWLATGPARSPSPGLAEEAAPDVPYRSAGTEGAREALYRARIPKLTIRTLGGFKVLRPDGEPISADNWQGSRPALLLKAILVHGVRHIPKDILVEALWPDQPPENSLRNFKTTLHRLRKVLEPDMRSGPGSAYIRLKDNLVSLDADLCEVDTEAFHRLCQRARRNDAEVDRHAAREMLHEAETLYQGDFLPEEPYLVWADMKRSNLRDAFIQLMYRLGRMLRRYGDFGGARTCYRHIVHTDTTQERALRRLMHLLADAGQPGEAVRLYRDFRTRLEADIGAAPDEKTTELYRWIRDRRQPPADTTA